MTSSAITQIKDDIIAFSSHMEFGIITPREVDFDANEEILISTKDDNIDKSDF